MNMVYLLQYLLIFTSLNVIWLFPCRNIRVQSLPLPSPASNLSLKRSAGGPRLLQSTTSVVFDDPIIQAEIDSRKVPSAVDITTFTILSSFVGVCASYAVHRGKILTSLINNLRLKQPIYSPLLGSLVLSLLYYFQKDVLQGPASLFTNLDGKTPPFSLRRQVIRFLGVALAIGSGNAVGFAGPMAELGMTVAKTISVAASRGSLKLRESSYAYLMDSLILAGSAAGFAANFDTPIAGVAFALEVSSRLTPSRQISSIESQQLQQTVRTVMILLAAASSSIITRRGSLLPITKFPFTLHYQLSSNLMSIFYVQHVVLGVLTGLLAFLFNSLFYGENTKRIIDYLPRIFRPMIGSMVSIISLFLIGESQALSDGFSYINRVLDLKFPSFISSLSYFVLKYASVGACFASTMVGGLVGPSLFMGSSLAQTLAAISSLRVQDRSIYYASGAAAMFASLFKSPFTAILLLVEMCNHPEVFSSLAIATITSIATMNSLSIIMVKESNTKKSN